MSKVECNFDPIIIIKLSHYEIYDIAEQCFSEYEALLNNDKKSLLKWCVRQNSKWRRRCNFHGPAWGNKKNVHNQSYIVIYSKKKWHCNSNTSGKAATQLGTAHSRFKLPNNICASWINLLREPLRHNRDLDSTYQVIPVNSCLLYTRVTEELALFMYQLKYLTCGNITRHIN